MAGSVIIDDKTAVGFSSRGFDVVAEGIRAVLESDAPDLIEPVYESLDVGGMSFIALDTLDPRDMERFAEAAERAFAAWMQRHPEPFPEWGELMAKVWADARLKRG